MKRAPFSLSVVLIVLAAFPRLGRAQSLPSDAIFDDAKLHRVDLYVNTRDWYFLKANYQTNDYYPATMRWNAQTIRDVAIRSRGLGSRNQAKPGLRVDFNRYVTGRTVLGLKALVLDNLTQDPSLLHELVSMKVFRRMGMQASRESLATLYVNNEYTGVYALIEEPDEVAMARMYADGSGYLYEYKWIQDWHFEDQGTAIAAYQPFFEPRTHETEDAVRLYQPIVSMVQAFNHAPDEDFETLAGAFIDIPQFLKHAAIQSYLAELDGVLGFWGLANFYLYRPTGSLRHRIVPWDEDNAFFWSRYPVDMNQQANVLMRRLMERASWRAQVLRHDPRGRGLGRRGSPAHPRLAGRAGWRLARGRSSPAPGPRPRRGPRRSPEAVDQHGRPGGLGRHGRVRARARDVRPVRRRPRHAVTGAPATPDRIEDDSSSGPHASAAHIPMFAIEDSFDRQILSLRSARKDRPVVVITEPLDARVLEAVCYLTRYIKPVLLAPEREVRAAAARHLGHLDASRIEYSLSECAFVDIAQRQDLVEEFTRDCARQPRCLKEVQTAEAGARRPLGARVFRDLRGSPGTRGHGGGRGVSEPEEILPADAHAARQPAGRLRGGDLRAAR